MGKIEKLRLEERGGVGDELRAEIDYGGMIAIEVEEPWAGDTEAGFGRTGAIRLTRDQALELASWLLKAAGEMK